MGSGRFALAALITQVAGALVGLAVASAVKLLDADWGFRLHIGTAVGPTTWIAGAAMAASASMDTLWRRRIRVSLLALTITLVLFAGQLQDVIRLGAVIVGLCIGPWIVHRSARGARISGTRREGRVLVAIVVAATSIGTMLAALSPHAVGPLSVLRDLFRGVPWTTAEVREICAESSSSLDCRRVNSTCACPARPDPAQPDAVGVPTGAVRRAAPRPPVRVDRLARRAGAAAGAVAAELRGPLHRRRRRGVALLRPRRPQRVQDTDAFPDAARAGGAAVGDPQTVRRAGAVEDLSQARRQTRRADRGSRCAVRTRGLWARNGFDRRPTAWTLLADFPERLVPPVYLQMLDPRLLPDDWASTLLYEWTGVVFWVVVCVLVGATFLRPAHGADTGAAERAREILVHVRVVRWPG